MGRTLVWNYYTNHCLDQTVGASIGHPTDENAARYPNGGLVKLQCSAHRPDDTALPLRNPVFQRNEERQVKLMTIQTLAKAGDVDAVLKSTIDLVIQAAQDNDTRGLAEVFLPPLDGQEVAS